MYKTKRFLLYIRQENIYCEKFGSINWLTTFKNVEKLFYLEEPYAYLQMII